MYKIIANMLASRLKTILRVIISLTKSVFVSRMLISDNVMVAYESLHTMQSRMKGEAEYVTLKLDMSKLYNKIKWKFIKYVMEGMGFARK